MPRKFVYTIFVLPLVITIFLISAAPSFASNKALYPIGELVALEGTAHSIGNNGKIQLRQGDPIYFGGEIETGSDSRALILFIDDTEITLGALSSLSIDEYVFDPYDAGENKGEFSFSKGVFLWASGMISKSDEPDVTLKTPQGSIGIRGTTIWGGAIQDGYGVYVADGRVRFSGEWGSTDIYEGNGVFIGERQTLGETKPWPKEILGPALDKVAFRSMNKAALERNIKLKKRGNIKKRHDYRGRMFPYKENPFRKKLKGEEDNFFSDEFENMRNRQ